MKKIVLQGIAYDGKSSFMKGPALAPPLIRDLYRSDAVNLYAENGREIAVEIFEDKGDCYPTKYFDIESFTSSNFNNKLPIITLGGDHSITYPVLRAIGAQAEPFQILHLDAHADLYDEFEGDRFSHACPFARIMEDGLAQKLTQVGVRTLTPHQREQAAKYGVDIIEMKDLETAAVTLAELPVYLSLDLDVLDPGAAPGISHHEPGGMSVRQLLHLIQNIEQPLIGADIVEYNPLRDVHHITASVGAKLLKEIAAKMLEE